MEKPIYLKIDKRIQNLNDSQAFIYLVIVYEKYQKKQINRQYLANALGVTNKEYISEIITEIEKAGLIKRANYINHSYKEGWIDVKLNWELKYESFFKVSVNFVRDTTIPSKMKGFILRYRSLAFDDTLVVSYNKKEIGEKLHISQPTLRKYLNLLNEYDCISCFITQTPNKETLTTEQMDVIKTLANKCEDGLIKNQCKWFIDKDLMHHQSCVNLYNRAISGTLFKNKENNNEANNSRYSFTN